MSRTVRAGFAIVSPKKSLVFSSIIAADAVNGVSFFASVRHAAVFIAKVLRRAVELDIPTTDGICFEEFLAEIGEGAEE